MREAILTNKLLSGDTSMPIEQVLSAWSGDPYDADFKEGTLMNKSEDEKHDASFPHHPLTLARKIVAQIKNDIKPEPEIRQLRPFYS